MSLPFSEEQFLRVFSEYNRAVGSAQVVLYIIGALALFLAARKHRRHSDKLIAAILALLWLWMGVAYHLIFFTTINKAAFIFAALFILQALLFFAAAQKSSLTFRFRSDIYGLGGAVLITYSLIVYPMLGYTLGHTYPAAPTFGLPCPTTIFTFGMLLWAEGRVPVHLLLIPLAWALVAASAAVSLGMIEDLGLVAAGVFSTTLIVFRNRRTLKIRIV